MARKKEGMGCSAKVEITEMMCEYSLEGLRCGVLMGRLRCGVHMEKRESDEKFAF